MQSHLQRSRRSSGIAQHQCDHHRHRDLSNKPRASIQLGERFLCLFCAIEITRERKEMTRYGSIRSHA